MVEQSQRLALILADADIKGDVLVHRVAGLGVVADGVLGAHAQAAEFLVQMPGLLAEAVKVILLPVHAGVVRDTAQVVLLESALGQIAVEPVPVPVEQSEGKGLLAQDKRQSLRLEAETFFVLRAGDVQRRDPLPLSLEEGVEAVGPGGGDKRVRGLVEGSLEADADADHIV